LFAENSYLRLAQNICMGEVHFVNFHSSRAPITPSHLRIIHVIKRLLGPLKKHNGRTEARRSEFLRPVGLPPIDARWFGAHHLLDLVPRNPSGGGDPLR
jgi:hypothetical protein